MRAVDTNIVVRIIVNDDAAQVARASAALASGDIYLSQTVCLETEWVLRSGYGLQARSIADHLTDFAGIPGVQVQEPDSLAQAISWLRQGMDFADALHLANAEGCDQFLSFDAALAKSAIRCGAMPVVSP